MKMTTRMQLLLAGLLLFRVNVLSQDTNLYVFLCFGQSNMEGFPGIEEQDRGPVDERFEVLAAVDFPRLDRKKGHWYEAIPPLCRPSSGLCPADYFGRTMVSNLPPSIKIGVVNVSVAGCRIELFDEETFQAYASKAPQWMTNIINTYKGNPYQYLVETAKLAQKDGVIKGILLHQGESNTNDKEWPNKVKRIYDNLLKDLNLRAQDVPLLAGEVVNADQQGACASMNAIIDELPRTIPNSHVISSKGCASLADHLHFTAAGYRELGRRYAETMLPLLGYTITAASAAPATSTNLAIPAHIVAGYGTDMTIQGTNWLAGNKFFPDGETIERPDITIATSINTGPASIYKAERYSMSKFTYAPVPNGDYTLKLHFCETFEGITGPGQRVFGYAVKGDGAPMKDFDLFATAGALKPVVRTVPVTVTNHSIEIEFTPQVENPQINALEIFSGR